MLLTPVCSFSHIVYSFLQYNAAKLKLSPPRISKVEISDHDQYSPPEPVRRPQLPRNPEPGVKYPPTSHHSSCSEWSSPPASPPSRRRPTKTPEPSKNVPKPKQSELRRIYYSVAEDNGEVLAHDDETSGTLLFEGSTIDELAHELQRMTGIDDIILCMKNPLSTKLYKMRLPANRAPLCVVIVRQNSRCSSPLPSSTQSSFPRAKIKIFLMGVYH